MSPITIKNLPLGMYQTNCYILSCESTKEAIVFDPADSGAFIFETLKKEGLTAKAILLTHGHFDHIYGVKELKQLSGATVYALDEEANLLKDPEINCSVSVGRSESIVPDIFLKDGQILNISDMEIKVIHTPGHTAGSTSYYFAERGILISGDTLFNGSVGRTDLPTGSMSMLLRSVKEKLFSLPEDVIVYPGHGEATSIGYEKDYNPFF